MGGFCGPGILLVAKATMLRVQDLGDMGEVGLLWGAPSRVGAQRDSQAR